MNGQFFDRITVAVYNRMMSLSADYHDNKNSATVWHTVRSSERTVTSFISSVCFELIPEMLDLVFAITTFGTVCGGRSALVMAIVLAVYVLILVQTSTSKDLDQWSKARKERNRLASDAIPNWWTVHSFGRLNYENDRYAKAVHHMRVVDKTYCEDQWLTHNCK